MKKFYLLALLAILVALPAGAKTGDVNGDNEVNISDVNAVIDIILGGVSNPSGDVNGDGEVNISDINTVIDIILGGGPEEPPVEIIPKEIDLDFSALEEPAETIYVETDGAQGRVWGHVTMRGDRGSGTIHDWDENTLTVTVTRHGDELFAVDQNSRQYVFKLKKQKTQE